MPQDPAIEVPASVAVEEPAPVNSEKVNEQEKVVQMSTELVDAPVTVQQIQEQEVQQPIPQPALVQGQPKVQVPPLH